MTGPITLRAAAVFAALLTLGAPTAARAQVDPSLPAPVRAYQQELADVCVRMEGRARFGPEFVQRADFDGDGRDDYLIDTAEASCPPLGSMGTCGSAGCSMALFLSSQGFREVWGGNLQGYEIVPHPRGAQLITQMHGSACGQIGAQVCDGVLEWNGSRFTRGERRLPETAASTAVPAVSAPPVAWTYGADRSGIGTARARLSPAPLLDLGLTCQEGRTMMAVRLDGRPTASAILSISAGGREAQIRLTLDRHSGVYFALPAPPTAILLLARGGASAEVSVNGRSAGRLPLDGAGNAIAAALGPCWRGESLAGDPAEVPPALTPAPAPAPAAPPFPPIPEGFYAQGGTCAGAARDATSYVYFTHEVQRWFDGDTPLTGFQNLGGGMWRMFLFHGGHKDIEITGPGSFRERVQADMTGLGDYREQVLTYTHCPLNTVPTDVRQRWMGPVDYTPYEGNG